MSWVLYIFALGAAVCGIVVAQQDGAAWVAGGLVGLGVGLAHTAGKMSERKVQ